MSRGTCRAHPGVLAVEECQICGRSTCLTCAIPVRGRVLCAECAAEQVGVPAPASPRVRRGWRWLDPVAALLFAAALGVSTLPWDREGALTSPFSAWRGLDRWPLLATLLLALALVLAIGPFRRAWPVARYAHPVLGTLAALAILVALSAPQPVRTPAPVLAFILAAAGAVVGIVRARRAVG